MSPEKEKEPEDVMESIDELKERLSSMKRMMEERKASWIWYQRPVPRSRPQPGRYQHDRRQFPKLRLRRVPGGDPERLLLCLL
ncbi:unnamed protein product [Colias eurytheme]|nr:unnamed protein product [Colias eurytheme]